MQSLPSLKGLNTALSASSSLLKGVAGLRAGQYNQGVYQERAQEELIAGNAQALMLRDQARQAIGDQLGAQYANGFEGGTGSAIESLAQSQINATLDMMELRRQAATKARALIESGDMAATEGSFALAQGLIGAGSTISEHMQDWAAAKTGQTLPPKRPMQDGVIVTRGKTVPMGY